MLAGLKDARLSHDPPLRLIDVATAAGVSVSLVSMVERGAPCSTAAKEALARALGASYGSFWEVAVVHDTPEPFDTGMLAGAKRNDLRR